MNKQLCWFRNDLRVRDNPALANALLAGPTHAIYIATPQQWQMHDDAPIKLDFWRRNLVELKKELKKLKVDLLCFQVATYKEVPELVQKLASLLQVSQLHYNREYPLNESRRDDLVNAMCSQQNIAVASFDDQLLAPPPALLNRSGLPYKVFTPFAKNARSIIQSDPRLYTEPRKPTKNTAELPPSPALPTQCDIAAIDWPAPKPEWEKCWPAGEVAANSRLQEYVQHKITTYKDQRNIPAMNSTSQMSAYLAAGIVSVADCWRSSREYCDGIGVETWQNELLWREFYRHIVHHFPQLCTHKPFRNNANQLRWRYDREEFAQWCNGQTGYPLVDAGMRQLLTCGWMHNRLRMVTAMFLSKHLLIDWRWGERWFMQNLIDGDFASNNGGWQWSASTGVDAVPYFRIFNPARQSMRFDPDGTYIRHYVPELAALPAKRIHEPAGARPADYPQPVVEHGFARERALNAFKGST